MKTIVYGVLGSQLDYGGKGEVRWQKWRPTISLCMQDDLLVDELHLLHDNHSTGLAKITLADIASVSPDTQVILHPTNFQDPWDFEEVYAGLYDLIRQHRFNSERNDYLINMTTGTHVAQICWFLLAESRHFPGRLLQISPGKGSDKVKGRYQTIDLNLARYDQIASRFRQEQLAGEEFLKGGIVTRNKRFNALIHQIETIAVRSKAPILLMGPTGAGKSELAKRIFQLKKRRDLVQGEMVAVNCATLRGDQSMSALFGHVKGAFTGAQKDRAGLLKSADDGLLFLDEIGELGLDEQATLLHALEEKRFYPIGSDLATQSRFILIAGTNCDLKQAAAEGRFREDLLARINLWTYQLPGLAERKEDIEPNIEYELRRFSESEGRAIRFNQEAWRQYLKFAVSTAATWRHNFRDLSASIYRMAILADDARITTAVVSEEVNRLSNSWKQRSTESQQDLLTQFLDSDKIAKLDTIEQAQLGFVIRTCQRHTSMASASRELFNISRLQKTTSNDSARLKAFLNRYQINWKSIFQS